MLLVTFLGDIGFLNACCTSLVVEFQHEGVSYSHLHYSNHFLIILKAFKIDSLL